MNSLSLKENLIWSISEGFYMYKPTLDARTMSAPYIPKLDCRVMKLYLVTDFMYWKIFDFGAIRFAMIR